MHTIAVAHHKGGVGKTSTTAHLAHALAEHADQHVLAVDLDPQASLTALTGADIDRSDQAPYMSAIDDGDLDAHIRHLPRWGIDLLPATQRLVQIEHLGRPGIEQQLRLMLETNPDRWDIVLIDPPGSLGVLTITALTAANSGVIVPTSPDFLALDPLGAIVGAINDIGAAYQPGCQLRGVVINAVARTREHRQQTHSLTDALGAHRILGQVPRRAVIQDAAAQGVPLTHIATGPAAECRDAYRHIATTLTGNPT